MQFYIKKICSQSPDQYEYIEHNKALKLYEEWLLNAIMPKEGYYGYEEYTENPAKYFYKYYKSFEQWNLTEI